MVWFKIDDKFHSHPKVVAAGNAAVGLFCRLGSWSSDHSTDGVIPADIVRLLGKRKEIDGLLASNLLKKCDNSYIIPDFLAFNPSAETVQAKRAASAERQRKARENAAKAREASQETSREVTDPSQRDESVSHGVVTLPPTRPDPKRSTRGPIWDALTDAFGAPTTASERSNRGKIVKELTEAEATPEDITARVQEHKRRRLNWTLTANALVKHWTDLAPRAGDRGDDVWDAHQGVWLTASAAR